jgi:hypothetical protein
MKSLIPYLVSVVALLFAGPARSSDTEETPQEVEKLAKELVRKLGNRDFRERESASRELTKLGVGALKVIEAGRNHSNPEIAARCERLISKIRKLDLERRIEELAADKEGRIANTLPLGGTYEKICGKDENARKFYIELCKSQLQFLDAAVNNPKAIGEAYFELSIEMQNRNPDGLPFPPDIKTPASAQKILAMLLIGSDDKIGPAIDEAMRKRPKPGYQPLSMVFWEPQFKDAFLDANTGPLFRKVLFEWIKRRNDPTNTTQTAVVSAIQLISEQEAGRFVADRQTIDFVLDTAVTPGQQPYTRDQLLGALNKLVKKEHLQSLEEKLFQNETKLQKNVNCNVNGKNIVVETQVRDFALALCIRPSEQKYSDYGFDILGPQPSMNTNWQFCGFSKDETRKAAFKKYAEWRKANSITWDEQKQD